MKPSPMKLTKRDSARLLRVAGARQRQHWLAAGSDSPYRRHRRAVLSHHQRPIGAAQPIVTGASPSGSDARKVIIEWRATSISPTSGTDRSSNSTGTRLPATSMSTPSRICPSLACASACQRVGFQTAQTVIIGSLRCVIGVAKGRLVDPGNHQFQHGAQRPASPHPD